MSTRRTALLTTAILLATAACGSRDKAGVREGAIVGGTDNSVYPEAAVIDMANAGGRAYCAGTLIAPRVILTAAHCIEGYSSWTIEVPAAAGGAREQMTSESLLWDWGERACGDHCLDVGLLFLPSPVTIERYPELATQAVAAGTKAVAVGRIDDGQYLASATRVSRPTILQVDGERYASSGLFLEKGDSGGPLFRAGTHELIGVSSAISRAQDFNVFQRFDTEVPSILQQIEAHGGRGANASAGTCRTASGDHAVGDSFVAPDDCNSCTCRAGGGASPARSFDAHRRRRVRSAAERCEPESPRRPQTGATPVRVVRVVDGMHREELRWRWHDADDGNVPVERPMARCRRAGPARRRMQPVHMPREWSDVLHDGCLPLRSI